jgi:hypothetical protein
MFHVVDNLQTRTGDALAGYYVKFKDAEGNYATLYADENGTPIATVSGAADAALSDAEGMYDAYLEDGNYLRDIYADAALTQHLKTIGITPMFSEGTVLADLASSDEDKGATLVFTQTGDTVQATLDGYATRTAIKALTAAAGRRVYLIEDGCEGTFVFRAGNFTSHIAADTQEGMYLKADGVAASAGAWVRQITTLTWEADWFRIPNDPASGTGGGSEVQCHTEMTAMANLANLTKPSTIQWGSKIYTLGAAIPEWSFQVAHRAARGEQGTIICKRYNETSETRGIFAFNDHGFTIDKILFNATSGEKGSAISAILTAASPANGRTYLIDVYVSVGQYCNHSLYVNGMTNTTGSGPGYRGLWIRGGEYFGAAVSAIHIEGAHHVFATGVFLTRTGVGTTSQIALDTDGSAEVYNDDWQWHGMISGVANLNWFGGGNNADGTPGDNGGRSLFCSPQVLGINVDANCTSTMWTGPKIPGGGVVTNNAGDGFVFTYAGTVVDSSNNVTSGYIIYGSGKIFQWGPVTTVAGEALANVLPVAFTSSNIQYSAQPATMPASNLVSVANVVKTAAAPLTQYDIRAGNLNISTGAVTANAATWRWTANGQ